MEDDPYCFLNYGLAPAPPVGSDAKFQVPNNPTFFSMDTQGRVLRFDSLSKTLSSGLRIGWVTGPSALIRQLELHQQATALHNSGLSQALTAKFLTHLGPAGVDAHFRDVALFYARRRDALLTAATKHLTGLARWSTPSAGMFIWFELLGVKDSMALIKQRAVEAKVLFIPGQVRPRFFSSVSHRRCDCVVGFGCLVPWLNDKTRCMDCVTSFKTSWL
jgi:kynurenine/2-aminoadipate aminotransferase